MYLRVYTTLWIGKRIIFYSYEIKASKTLHKFNSSHIIGRHVLAPTFHR